MLKSYRIKTKKCAFTLPEALITAAIIGIVAVITISSTVANVQQIEFKTGLRKAVTTLNSAITMNIVKEGESPYDNPDLYEYLKKSLNTMNATTSIKYKIGSINPEQNNAAIYTVDGMRYEFSRNNGSLQNKKLHESDTILCEATHPELGDNKCGGCGSFGLPNNSNETIKAPCLIMVDVNGDRKPTPSNVNCKDDACANENKYKYVLPTAKSINDIFTIMITDEKAVPFGVVAQKVMYNARK